MKRVMKEWPLQVVVSVVITLLIAPFVIRTWRVIVFLWAEPLTSGSLQMVFTTILFILITRWIISRTIITQISGKWESSWEPGNMIYAGLIMNEWMLCFSKKIYVTGWI